MYNLFAMNSSAQLFHLGNAGWKRWSYGRPNSGFPSVEEVRHHLFSCFIGELSDTVDAYIAELDSNGMILRIFSLWE